MSETFAADWLCLRAAADGAARDAPLAQRAARWLGARDGTRRITDLGAGAGNNPAWLAPRLPGPQRWTLVDHDAALLGQAGRRLAALRDASGWRVEITVRRRDLAEPAEVVPAGTDLATASALLDLVSEAWVEALAARCAACGAAALFVLTIDGSWGFHRAGEAPGEAAADARMRARLAAHQQRDKGLGRALGGRAPDALARAFQRRGYRVSRARSDWRLEPGGHTRLALALLDGWRAALRAQSPGATEEIDAWWSQRRADVAAGALGVRVGHVDLWAEPPAP